MAVDVLDNVFLPRGPRQVVSNNMNTVNISNRRANKTRFSITDSSCPSANVTWLNPIQEEIIFDHRLLLSPRKRRQFVLKLVGANEFQSSPFIWNRNDVLIFDNHNMRPDLLLVNYSIKASQILLSIRVLSSPGGKSLDTNLGRRRAMAHGSITDPRQVKPILVYVG